MTCPPPVTVSTQGANQVISGIVTDGSGKTASTSVKLNIDKTPPVLAITSPLPGAVSSTAQVTITGTVSDALSGVAAVTCGGSAATITGTNFTCTATLALGSNTVAVNATDVSGNNSGTLLSITFGNIPTVTFTAPANLSYLNLSPTTVNGTVDDPTASVTINSIAAPVANGRFSVTLPLAEGPNIITATAKSASGTAGTASIQVTLDTTPPHVTITSPPDKFVTTDATVSIAGNVNDMSSEQ